MSVTSAIGWAGLFNGFAGEDGEKASPQELLPFQEATPKESRVSAETLMAVKNLISRGVLPPVIHSQISQFLE